LAAIVGLIIWHCCVHGIRLGHIKSTIDILKSFSITKKKDWDLTLRQKPSEQWLADATLLLNQIIENQWSYAKKECTSGGEILLCASDASDDLGGGIILSLHGDLVDFISYAEERSTHIFIKEAVAVSNLVARILRKNPQKIAKIKIAVDNQPCRRAFEKGYSSNSTVARIIDRCLEKTDARNIVLEFIDIHTDINVGDCMTRRDHHHGNHICCPHRLQGTWEVLMGIRLGRETSSSSSTKFSCSKLSEASHDKELIETLDSESAKADDWMDTCSRHFYSEDDD
jgi:hypothetical protein